MERKRKRRETTASQLQLYLNVGAYSEFSCEQWRMWKQCWKNGAGLDCEGETTVRFTAGSIVEPR